MKTSEQSGIVLRRRDVIELEPLLGEMLARVIPFTAHGLYFPQENAPDGPVWLSQERKLLLPLERRGEVLGVFIARGVDARAVKRVLHILPALAGLCLDNLELYQQSRRDSLTGLALRQELLTRMVREADMVRGRLSQSPDGEGEGSAPLHRACMGLISARWEDMDNIARRHGYGFADTLLASLARALSAELPDEVLAARTGDAEFTLLAPAATRTVCQKLAEAMLERLETVSLSSPLTRRAVRPRLAVGHALYPQDMEGTFLGLPMSEQARILLRRAEMAATVAGDGNAAGCGGASSRIMGFNRILSEGGVIREIRPMGRAVVSLGRAAGAREGLRFSVWTAAESALDRPRETPSPRYKGEIVLMEVHESTAVAETLHLSDPACSLTAGDTLRLLTDAQPLHDGGIFDTTPQPDPETGLQRHGNFLHRLARERENHSSFVLALIRAILREGAVEHAAMRGDVATAQPERGLAEIVERCLGYGKEESFTAPTLGGRYGVNSLAFFYPSVDVETLAEQYRGVCTELAALGWDAAVGLMPYPYLQFRKGETLECCHKALEFALLLPDPRVGIFGSLALNISADKRYSLGDVFGAVEEYKLALLADADNIMAWNSLGVCMATLARHHEAQRYFKEALKRNNGDAAALYNLGAVCQSLGETRAAARHFRECIAADPEHLFAHIRLGQLAERAGRLKDARGYYSRAAALEDKTGESGGLARRYLARVALRRRKGEEARELLHEALVRNPQDAAAMEMLAGLYLDGGEDPAMAEMLARQSVGLRPEHKESWLLLARALRALGREADAGAAEVRAERA